MTWDSLVDELCALLEPWDVGGPQGSGDSALWCGSYALVRERLPHLPQVREEQPPTACIDLIVERSGDRATRVDYEGYAPGETLAHLGLVRQAQEYAAAVPGPVESAGPAVLAALRLVLAREDVRRTSHGTYRALGTEPTGAAAPDPGIVRPALALPGGPLLDGHYLGDLAGAAHRHPLVVVDLPWRRVADLVPMLDAVRADMGPGPVDLVAHSAGAALALTYLSVHPDRVRRLVLVCPAIRRGARPAPDRAPGPGTCWPLPARRDRRAARCRALPLAGRRGGLRRRVAGCPASLTAMGGPTRLCGRCRVEQATGGQFVGHLPHRNLGADALLQVAPAHGLVAPDLDRRVGLRCTEQEHPERQGDGSSRLPLHGFSLWSKGGSGASPQLAPRSG